MHIILLKCQIAFLKFTSCGNQALVGCISIAAVAVHLKLKSQKFRQSSHKMYSNNILNFQVSTTILYAHMKKSLETYRMNLEYKYIYILYIYIVYILYIYCIYIYIYIYVDDYRDTYIYIYILGYIIRF